MSFYEPLVLILGQPNSFAAEILIYTLVAIIFLRIFEAIIQIILSLIRGVRP
jgi:hypothetical protein